MADVEHVSEVIPDVEERLDRLAALPPRDDYDEELDLDAIREARDSWWREKVAPRRFADAAVDQLDGEAARVADEWDGTRNVLLLGAVGVGKTHTALALAREVYRDGHEVAFWPVVELLDAMRPGGDGEVVMRRVLDVALLILDDLGAERPTDWTAQQLYSVVNRRWLEQRPTIVTSNLAPDDLEKAVGPRMWSRLYHGALRLTVAGEDRRRDR